MKHFLFIILLVLFTVSASAQRYQVYTVSGKVTTSVGGKTKSVTPKMSLTAATTLTVADASRIVLINELAKQMCTIKGAAKGTVKQLLGGKTASVKTVSPQYIAVLMKKSSGNTSRSAYMQSAATSYRDLDSLFVDDDSVSHKQDSIVQKKDTVEKKKTDVAQSKDSRRTYQSPSNYWEYVAMRQDFINANIRWSNYWLSKAYVEDWIRA